jgi:hypothetical protein
MTFCFCILRNIPEQFWGQSNCLSSGNEGSFLEGEAIGELNYDIIPSNPEVRNNGALLVLPIGLHGPVLN